MKKIEIYKTTTNRSVYNKIRKDYEAYCPRCRWHRGCNNKLNLYGGIEEKRVRYPNWKLVSKNKKQWMPKTNFKKEYEYNHNITWILFKF